MNIAYFLGIVCGVAVMVLLVNWKMNKKGKCMYDERQELIRGRGFKYGFFTLIIYDLLLAALRFSIVADEGMYLIITQNETTIMFMGVIIGVLVYACYCVWNGGYVGVNQNQNRALIIFVTCGILNLVIAGADICHGQLLLENGRLDSSAANLACGIMILIIAAVMYVKKIVDSRQGEE